MKFCVYHRKRGKKRQMDRVGFVVSDRIYPVHQFFSVEQVNQAYFWEHSIDLSLLSAEKKEELRQHEETINELLKHDSRFVHLHLYSRLKNLFPFALYARLQSLLPDQATVESASSCPLAEVELIPLSYLYRSLRDFYAFEEHVKTARGNRGLDVPLEWYQFPVFYFSNHNAVICHDKELQAPKYGQWLDYELEVAAVIGKRCQDIAAEDADKVIAGYTIMNDWSLRDLQREEVKVGLGPAKGKDFATTLGPFLVTPDELEDRRSGKGYDLEMVARVNGVELSRGNWRDIHYSFGEMIARASQGVSLQPGDVIGSGTVGTGCILELGAEKVAAKLGREHGWLMAGDVVELEVERLGVLRNKVVSG